MAADPVDEMLMAIAVLEKDISDNAKSISMAESKIADYNVRLARQELIFQATRDALVNLLESPVIMLSEFRSLKSGIKISRDELGNLKKKLETVTAARNKALANAPALARQLQEVQDRLDQYEPPRKVLEFPSRDQQ